MIITVSGPSDASFISFKNSLQEYCQKTGLAVPSYKSFKSGYGYSATVELSNGKRYHTQSIQKDKKEAEQFAALETLKSLSLLPLNTNFVNPPKPQLGGKCTVNSLNGDMPVRWTTVGKKGIKNKVYQMWSFAIRFMSFSTCPLCHFPTIKLIGGDEVGLRCSNAITPCLPGGKEVTMVIIRERREGGTKAAALKQQGPHNPQ